MNRPHTKSRRIARDSPLVDKFSAESAGYIISITQIMSQAMFIMHRISSGG